MFSAHFGKKLVRKGNLLNGRQDGFPGQAVPRRGQDSGVRVFLPEHTHGGLQLFLTELLGTGEDDGAGGFNLIVIELAEIFHIDPDLGSIGDGDKAVEFQFRHIGGGILHGDDHIRELPHAGGFNENPVGVELLLHVLQRLMEVAHQRAADAPGGHLGNLHAGLLQKPAVDADFAEFVLNQHQLFPREGFGQQLFDKGCLARAQESGDNINFCHSNQVLCLKISITLIITLCPGKSTADEKFYKTGLTDQGFFLRLSQACLK